jgi:hypothetical protein
MPPRRLVVAFLVFWVTLGLVVLSASVQTFHHGLGHLSEPGHLHLAVAGGFEAVAAALFLVPRTVRVGGIALLAIFALALLVNAGEGRFPSELLLYAAGTAFVLVHGPVSWRAALFGGAA